MNRTIKERVKSILIMMLLIIGTIQVGILWAGQSHGFPTGILAAIFDSHTSVDSATTSRDLFVPYRTVLSNGDRVHWIIGNDHQDFEKLWSDGKTCLSSIIKGKFTKLESEVAWRDITARRGITFSFKAAINPQLLRWYLELEDNDAEIPTLLKLKIVPDLSGKSADEIYVYSGSGMPDCYRADNFEAGVSLQKMLTALENEEDASVREYINMRDGNQDVSLRMEPDILYVVASPKYWEYSNVRAALPDKLADAALTSDPSVISKDLLGSEMGRYRVNTYDEGTFQFNDSNNIYKIYSDGLLEYNYLQKAGDSEKGTVDDALLNAYKFLNTGKALLNNAGNVDLKLSGIDETANGFYTFRFDYYIGGYPISMELNTAGSGDPVTSGIVINADEKRVLMCRWVLRTFTLNGIGLYHDRFLEIMPSPEKDETTRIKDVSFGYVLDMAEELIIKPSLVIEKVKGTDNTVKVQTVALPEKSGG